VRIAGSGTCRPSTLLSSVEIDRRLGRADGWCEGLSGVRTRAIADGETAVDLAAEASRRALDHAGMTASDVGCVIATAAVPHQGIPTTAVLVQRALGLSHSSVPAFDVNATCIGFLAGLDVAGALIASGRYDSVLICSADLPSRGTSWETPEIKAIFGDGAAAVVLTRDREQERGVLALALETYSEGASACELRACGTGLDPHEDLPRFLSGTRFEMDGPLAYRVAARYLPRLLRRLLAKAGIGWEDVDVVVPHQASALAMEHMRRRLKVAPEKIVDVFATHGNQVSASLPTALHAALADGRVRAGGIALLIGTAAGVTVGGAVMRL
jgi:3-oxoacyl-[acyl-carrier-protein] synthase-3